MLPDTIAIVPHIKSYPGCVLMTACACAVTSNMLILHNDHSQNEIAISSRTSPWFSSVSDLQGLRTSVIIVSIGTYMHVCTYVKLAKLIKLPD